MVQNRDNCQTWDTKSGTCASSYDNTKCGLEMTVQAYPATTPLPRASSVTWDTQPSHSDYLAGTATFHIQSDEWQNTLISIPLWEYVDSVAHGMENNGLVLQVAIDNDTTRREQRWLHDDPDKVCGRAVQRDVVLGHPWLLVKYESFYSFF